MSANFFSFFTSFIAYDSFSSIILHIFIILDNTIIGDTMKKQETVKTKFYQIFWIFVLGCFIGSLYEVMLCFIKNGYLSYRQGLIYGPFYPVYGFGAVLFFVTICNMKKIISIFITGSILGGLFEYTASLLQDIIFSTVNWDYSNIPFNLQGRTSLLHAMGWGLIGVLFVYVLAPFLSKLIDSFPKKLGFVLTWIFLFFFLFDFSITSFALYRYKERRQNIPATHKVDYVLDNNYPDTFIKKRFPTMKESFRLTIKE